jgi:hypothetical protein
MDPHGSTHDHRRRDRCRHTAVNAAQEAICQRTGDRPAPGGMRYPHRSRGLGVAIPCQRLPYGRAGVDGER